MDVGLAWLDTDVLCPCHEVRGLSEQYLGGKRKRRRSREIRRRYICPSAKGFEEEVGAAGMKVVDEEWFIHFGDTRTWVARDVVRVRLVFAADFLLGLKSLLIITLRSVPDNKSCADLTLELISKTIDEVHTSRGRIQSLMPYHGGLLYDTFPPSPHVGCYSL